MSASKMLTASRLYETNSTSVLPSERVSEQPPSMSDAAPAAESPRSERREIGLVSMLCPPPEC